MGGAKPQNEMLKGRSYFKALEEYADTLAENDLIPRILFRSSNGVSLKA